MKAQIAGKTDTGCVRANNEDSFGFDAQRGIVVVCDGMGGQAAGEVASHMGVNLVLDYLKQHVENGNYSLFGSVLEGVSADAQALASAIQFANQQIRNHAAQNSELAGMGTTIVAGLFRPGRVAIANVGDSRIYLVRNPVIRQLTIDHSLVMEQIRRGMMTAEEAERSGLQNYILRALGAEDSVDTDVADLDVEPDDILLFTSDGLIRHVPDSDIAGIVASAPSLEAACDTLIQSAKRAGGTDNITCVLVRVVEHPC